MTTNKMPRFKVRISVNREEVIEAATFGEAYDQLWESIMNNGDHTIDVEELEEDDGVTGVHTSDVLDYLSAIREGDPRTD